MEGRDRQFGNFMRGWVLEDNLGSTSKGGDLVDVDDVPKLNGDKSTKFCQNLHLHISCILLLFYLYKSLKIL